MSTHWHDRPDPRFESRTPVRIALGIAAVLLASWMSTFLFGTDELTYHDFSGEPIEGGGVLTVRCEPVSHAGTGWSFDVVSGPNVLDSDVVDDINADCDRHRTAAVGYLGVLAVPTAILGMLSLARLTSRLS